MDLIEIADRKDYDAFLKHPHYRNEIELQFPYDTLCPRLVLGTPTGIGMAQRTDYEGKRYELKEVYYQYPMFKTGKFDTQVWPLDIKHGLDWDNINRDLQSVIESPKINRFLDEEHEPLRESHSILGFFFPAYRFAYITDASHVPTHTVQQLENKVDKLVINGLWPYKKHVNHLSMLEALDVAIEIGVREAYVVHVTNKVFYSETNEYLAQWLALKPISIFVDFLTSEDMSPEHKGFFIDDNKSWIQKHQQFIANEDKINREFNHVSLYMKTKRLKEHIEMLNNSPLIKRFDAVRNNLGGLTKFSPSEEKGWARIDKAYKLTKFELAYDSMEIPLTPTP
jgi:hypothetical protein